jgi:tRNA(Ile)-lysidine synthase
VHPSLSQKLLDQIHREKFVRAGDRVGVAVSGGADSVALLLLFLELREKLGIVLSVVHFNHKLRGKASDADEKFVAKLATKQDLEFHLGFAEVAKRAKAERANLEDAARRARYQYFDSLVESAKLTKIAVAHTADDQAETVLAHLMRGTGLAGLGGIHPVAGCVFRPLLHFRRHELRSFLKAKKQPWREDLTNRDIRRTRARIRSKLLPFLEKQFQPAIVEHLATLADLAREDEAYFDSLLDERSSALVHGSSNERRISIADLLPYTKNRESGCEILESAHQARKEASALALSKRLIRKIVEHLKARPGQLGAAHVGAVLELACDARSGSSLSLPGGVEVRKHRDELVFRKLELSESGGELRVSPEYEHNIDFRGGCTEVQVPQLGCVLRFRVIDWPPQRGETIIDKAVLDRDRLRFPVVLRNWRPGDRLRPLGHKGAHKLKGLLNKKHISRWERNGWPVLACGETLVWARGFPVAAEFAADERTRAGILIAEEQL